MRGTNCEPLLKAGQCQWPGLAAGGWYVRGFRRGRVKGADAALGRIRGQTRTLISSYLGGSLRLLGSVAAAPSGPCKRRAWIEPFVLLAVGEIWRHVTSVMKYKT